MKKSILLIAIIGLIFNVSCKKNPSSPKNTEPIPSFIINPTTGTTTTVFTFNANGSTDKEDDSSELKVRWDWDNNGDWDTNFNTTKTATHQYYEPGTYTIVLEVEDSDFLTNTVTKTLDVSQENTAPTASFTVNPTTGLINTIFNFDASSSSDNEDDTSILQVRWDWNNDGTYDSNYNTVKTTTHQYTIDGVYTVKLEVKDSEGWTHSAEKQVTVERPSTVVTFSDANFEALIRVTLSKQNGDITDLDLENIIQLNGGGWNISDITGIDYCVNLQNLDLRDNQIVDINALSSLYNLQTLTLMNNQVVDINALSDLINLQVLGLSSNQITQISSLWGLINLNLLYLSNNHIIDITTLGNLLKLTELNLSDNQIVDIFSLTQNSGMGSGDTVILTNNPLSDLSINTYIPQLEALGVTITN